MNYVGLSLKNSIQIDQIFSVHYFEYMSDFSFEGESHDFWEFVCVDKGLVNISSGNSTSVLHKDEIAFHAPNEFHDVNATGKVAPNLVTISFSTKSPDMEFFRGKILKINDMERNILANIIMEAKNCFDCRLDLTYQYEIPIKKDPSYGSEQLLRMYIEQFLLHLKRRYLMEVPAIILNGNHSKRTTKSRNDQEVFHRIVDYMEAHINSHLTIEQICKDNLVGRSQLQKIFKHHCDRGIIEHFAFLKIKAAKELIRTGNRNFTQISDMLGYSSIHYFSRQFKKVTGMTPSEYATSIKAIAEKP